MENFLNSIEDFFSIVFGDCTHICTQSNTDYYEDSIDRLYSERRLSPFTVTINNYKPSDSS